MSAQGPETAGTERLTAASRRFSGLNCSSLRSRSRASGDAEGNTVVSGLGKGSENQGLGEERTEGGLLLRFDVEAVEHGVGVFGLDGRHVGLAVNANEHDNDNAKDNDRGQLTSSIRDRTVNEVGPGSSGELDDFLELVHGGLAREHGLPAQQLAQDAADRPHVHALGVAARRSQQASGQPRCMGVRKTQATGQTATYRVEPSRISGARYHRVAT